MKKRIIAIAAILLAVVLSAVAYLVYRHDHPRIKRTVGIQAEGHRVRLEERFSAVFLTGTEVTLVDRWYANRESNVNVGYTFLEPGDDGNFKKFTVSGIEKDGVMIDYLSHFDHRTWGKRLIEEDTGTVKIRWKQRQ